MEDPAAAILAKRAAEALRAIWAMADPERPALLEFWPPLANRVLAEPPPWPKACRMLFAESLPMELKKDCRELLLCISAMASIPAELRDVKDGFEFPLNSPPWMPPRLPNNARPAAAAR